MRLTQSLRAEYAMLFDTCVVRSEYRDDAACIVTAIYRNRERYDAVGKPLGIPWHVVGIIHSLEASLRWDRHLHNGDPLSDRTQSEPKGRPEDGTPPFRWDESAFDALHFARLHRWDDWTIAGTLYRLEKYNGFGYRTNHPNVLSPYLWGFSNHYDRGKYVADGQWSEDSVSQQCGGAVLLKEMMRTRMVDVLPEGCGVTFG